MVTQINCTIVGDRVNSVQHNSIHRMYHYMTMYSRTSHKQYCGNPLKIKYNAVRECFKKKLISPTYIIPFYLSLNDTQCHKVVFTTGIDNDALPLRTKVVP